MAVLRTPVVRQLTELWSRGLRSAKLNIGLRFATRVVLSSLRVWGRFSYKREDRHRVQLFCLELQKLGFEVAWDQEILTGDPWENSDS